VSEVQNLLQTLSKTKQELVFVEDYLVDKVWHDRPARSKEFVTSHTKYAGESSYSKLEKLRQYTKNGQAEAYVLQELSEIAWLLNLRGKDIPFSPVFFAYLLVTSEDATLFVDRDKIVGEVLNYLQQDLRVSVRPYEEVWSALKSCSDRKIPVSCLRDPFMSSKCSCLLYHFSA
jgi:Xaa-Pro aminopeptidase